MPNRLSFDSVSSQFRLSFPGFRCLFFSSFVHRFFASAQPFPAPLFAAWHNRPPHARVDPFGRWLSCDKYKICKIFTDIDNSSPSSPLLYSKPFLHFLNFTYSIHLTSSYTILYHFHPVLSFIRLTSSQGIFGHRPALEAGWNGSICRVQSAAECSCVETSLDDSTR